MVMTIFHAFTKPDALALCEICDVCENGNNKEDAEEVEKREKRKLRTEMRGEMNILKNQHPTNHTYFTIHAG